MNGVPWRLVIDGANDAFMNMAVDEAILLHSIQQESPPTLRFYEWEKPSISIGYALDAETEVNLPLCRQSDVPVVRRITGGGLVFHKCDITYAIVFPDRFGGAQRSSDAGRLSVLQSYQLVNHALQQGLSELGVVTSLLDREQGTRDFSSQPANVCFRNPTVYDILHKGRKLAGSAQRRKKGWVLHHGSMLLSSDFVTMCPLVPHGETPGGVGLDEAQRGRPSSEGDTMDGRAVCLEEILGHSPPRARIVEALSHGLAQYLQVEVKRGPLTSSEIEMAKRLRQEKYSIDDWNMKRAQAAEAQSTRKRL